MSNEKIFLSIAEAARYTGLSQFYIRNGCKDGSVPCIKTGAKYLVNLPKLLEKLNQESMNA